MIMLKIVIDDCTSLNCMLEYGYVLVYNVGVHVCILKTVCMLVWQMVDTYLASVIPHAECPFKC